MNSPDPTIVVSYAGGYCHFRLVHSGGKVILEHQITNMDVSDGPWEVEKEFDSPSEAWLYVGRALGCLPCTHDTNGDGDCQYCHRTGVCYQRRITKL